jgi:hypothetical protein
VDPARLARTQLVADDAPLICTLGRDGRDADRPLSADALERLVPPRRRGRPASAPGPPARAAPLLPDPTGLGTPIQRIARFAGHADIRVTQQYPAAGDPDLTKLIEWSTPTTPGRWQAGCRPCQPSLTASVSQAEARAAAASAASLSRAVLGRFACLR